MSLAFCGCLSSRQLLCQRQTRASQVGLDRVEWHAQRLGDLFQGTVLHAGEKQYLALGQGQLWDLPLEPGQGVGGDGGALTIRRRGPGLRVGQCSRLREDQLTDTSLPKVAACGVGDDGEKPGGGAADGRQIAAPR